jgi:hypothetical protein
LPTLGCTERGQAQTSCYILCLGAIFPAKDTFLVLDVGTTRPFPFSILLPLPSPPPSSLFSWLLATDYWLLEPVLP